HPIGPAVHKQFDCLAIRVAGYLDDMAFLALPIPMRKDVQNRLADPLALIKVEAIFLEAAGVNDAGGRTLHRPSCFSQVINASPHEIAGNVIMYVHKLPQLFHVDVSSGQETGKSRRKLIWKQGAVIAADAAHRFAFRADKTTLRKRGAVDAVIFFPSVAPPVYIVVTNDIELIEKLRSRGLRGRFRRNVIAANRNGTRRILRVKDF